MFAAVASIAAAVSAGVSLYQQILLKRSAREQRKKENQLLWYNKIALETIVPMLNDTIDSAERRMQGCKGVLSEEGIEQMHELYDEIIANMQSIEEILQLIELFDKDAYKKCLKAIDQIRERYSDDFNKAFVQKYFYFTNNRFVHREKKAIIGKLLAGSARMLDN